MLGPQELISHDDAGGDDGAGGDDDAGGCLLGLEPDSCALR